MVTASSDKTARLWEVATGQALAGVARAPGSGVSAAFSPPDGKLVVTASSDNTARLWEVATKQILLGVARAPGNGMARRF